MSAIIFIDTNFYFYQASSARNLFGILSYIIYVLTSSFIDFIYCHISECLIEKVQGTLWNVSLVSLSNSLFYYFLGYLNQLYYSFTKSTSIGHKLYEVEWYNMKPQYVRPMILIIIRSQKPLKLSAQNFFSLSLATFKSVRTYIVKYWKTR